MENDRWQAEQALYGHRELFRKGIKGIPTCDDDWYEVVGYSHNPPKVEPWDLGYIQP